MVAKLCVGLIQTWIILEIALRMKLSTNPIQKEYDAGLKRIIIGQIAVLIVTSLGFLTYIAFAVHSANEPGNVMNLPFDHHFYLLGHIIGYSFLVLFLLMASVNVALIVQIRAMNKRRL